MTDILCVKKDDNTEIYCYSEKHCTLSRLEGHKAEMLFRGFKIENEMSINGDLQIEYVRA